MTKPTPKARRADEWIFDMPAGTAVHVPTQLQFRLMPFGPHVDNSAELARLQAAGWLSTGHHGLPPGVEDRRTVQIEPGDANPPGATDWHVLVDRARRDAAFDALATTHGPAQAQEMVQRICREAGERWVYRARLERGWPDGRRAR